MLQFESRARRRGYRFIAGVDESGRGPLAGPVVACACILKNPSFKEKICDSKKLSPLRRERAFFEILQKAHIGIGIIDNLRIDEENILNATKKAMQVAIYNLNQIPDYCLIDGPTKIDLYCKSRSIVNGESKSLSIAAASIVAKVIRDALMLFYDKIYPQYGFAIHKGYGTKMHMDAIKRFGPVDIHRRSFSPIKDILS